ncbi:hypothetical protein Tco_0729167 [Tanacetum coccineum]|uniref:Uncharacterized protein n=1 Tax=Tanacetum coccineum TaxID=301880 RepID=A0ABQ4YPE4_9ASTR
MVGAWNTKKNPSRMLKHATLATKRATPKSPQPPPQSNNQASSSSSKETFPSVSFPQKVRKGKSTAFQSFEFGKTLKKREKVKGDCKLTWKRAIRFSLIRLSATRRDQTPPDSTTGPSSQPEDDTSEKVIHESSSTSDSERTESDTETGAPKGDKSKVK